MHRIIKTNIERHIQASGSFLPQSAGLPGAHAEVQAANFMLYLQHEKTGSTDPKLIEVMTQKLQHRQYAESFPACYNCRGTLVATYDDITPAFNVPTGSTETNSAIWRAAADKKDATSRR